MDLQTQDYFRLHFLQVTRDYTLFKYNHALIWGVLGTPLVCSPSGEFGLHGLQGVQGGAPDPRVGPLLPLWGWVSQTIKKTITTYLEAWRCPC